MNGEVEEVYGTEKQKQGNRMDRSYGRGREENGFGPVVSFGKSKVQEPSREHLLSIVSDIKIGRFLSLTESSYTLGFIRVASFHELTDPKRDFGKLLLLFFFSF